eukprot:14585652-Alexandrium_andersonii.AAC.1
MVGQRKSLQLAPSPGWMGISVALLGGLFIPPLGPSSARKGAAERATWRGARGVVGLMMMAAALLTMVSATWMIAVIVPRLH